MAHLINQNFGLDFSKNQISCFQWWKKHFQSKKTPKQVRRDKEDVTRILVFLQRKNNSCTTNEPENCSGGRQEMRYVVRGRKPRSMITPGSCLKKRVPQSHGSYQWWPSKISVSVFQSPKRNDEKNHPWLFCVGKSFLQSTMWSTKGSLSTNFWRKITHTIFLLEDLKNRFEQTKIFHFQDWSFFSNGKKNENHFKKNKKDHPERAYGNP